MNAIEPKTMIFGILVRLSVCLFVRLFVHANLRNGISYLDWVLSSILC